MKKSTVVRALVAVVVVAVACGCAGMKKGPTDLELVKLQIENFKVALLAKDVEKVFASVSDNFYHPEAGDKAGAKELIKQGIDSGYTEDGQLDLTKMEVKIDKDVATAYPIIASAKPGSVTVGLTLKKEKTKTGVAWLITEINVEGI